MAIPPRRSTSCEFYAREMLRLAGPQPLHPLAGEDNELYYIPLGRRRGRSRPGTSRCAILVGMTAAAVVTGNTVVLKPSTDRR